ncbi:MAG: VWA domain-containing protein [Halioglobus sp.]
MNTYKPFSALLLAGLVVACAEQSGPQQVETSNSEVLITPSQTLPREQREVTQREDENTVSVDAAINNREYQAQVAPAAKLSHSRTSLHAKMAADSVAGGMYHSPFSQFQPGDVDRENYLHYDDNGVFQVSQNPVSTFSVDVDTAGYANVRRMLVREGRLPPSDAVRLEEMVNYFSYSYETPEPNARPFTINTELAPAPWSDGHHLLQIGLKGFEPKAEQRPAANLVFLVDVSGSMQSADKLGLVKKSLRLLVNKMTAEDRIALAVYAGAAGIVLESTPGNEKAKILAAIDGLQAGGSTHGSAGIKLAYSLAEQYKIDGGINRVIIASDGDMNVGTVNLEALKDLVEAKRQTGVALSTLGFGSGNYNYALMEQIADVGNGNAAYIDSLKEAQKVLVNEMQSTLLTIASDVKIQIEFNPAQVSEYRLIGYENRMLNKEDFKNDKVDAGDIGAGHTVTALYEIVLAGGGSERIAKLRYDNKETTVVDNSGELAFVKLRYKQPGTSSSIEVSKAIVRNSVLDSLASSSTDLRFAASVAGFGQILQGGKFTGNWGYDEALTLARNARGNDPHGYRSEFVHLIELAQSLSSGT